MEGAEGVVTGGEEGRSGATEFFFEPDTGNFIDIPASEVNREKLHELSRRFDLSIYDLTALEQGHDPFNIGTPRQHRQADKFAAIMAANNLTGGHQRGLWYQVMHGGVDVGMTWREFGEAMNYARILGTVDPWKFSERRTRTLLEDERGDGLATVRFEKPSFWLPESPGFIDARIRSFHPHFFQPVRVLVVVEKDDEDLFEEIRPLCEEYGADLAVTTGNSTWGYAWALADRARRDGLDDDGNQVRVRRGGTNADELHVHVQARPGRERCSGAAARTDPRGRSPLPRTGGRACRE
jgi:hypothetical protein